jgi:hypothetical protein
MQVFEPLGPGTDFLSIIVALIGGGITSRFGGFWFYPGAIFSFILFRAIALNGPKWVAALRGTRSVSEPF